MTDSRIGPRVDATNVVVSGGIAARQFEGFLARRRLFEGRSAWLTPVVQTRQAWANELWTRYLDDGRSRLLTPGQADAMWRRVIEESDESHGLLGYRQGPALAREASQRLRDWNVDRSELGAFQEDSDCQVFARWERAYRSALLESGWVDPADVETALGDTAQPLPPEPGDAVVWADMTLTPAQVRLSRGLRDAGHRLDTWRPHRLNRDCVRVQLPDPSVELRVAAEWAAEKLARNPRQRVAIVISEMDSRRGEVARNLEDALYPEQSRLGAEGGAPIMNLGGRPPTMENPVIGAALTALELFSPRGHFQVLSRWLRSPFFVAAPAEMQKRCRLELQLRTHIASQLEFLEGFRSCGLAERIKAESPELTEVLASGAEHIGAQPARATPTHWAGVWRRLLNLLGWHAGVADAAALEDWEAALNDLSLLTPVLGEVTRGDALTELERILARPQRLGSIPLGGVFLLANPEDVGPGYDALWISGLTDALWPRAPQPSPLLPLTLQRAHGMPMTLPSDALEHSQLTLRRAIDRVPDVVLSSPGSIHDYPAQPSPLIVPYTEKSASDLVRRASKRFRQSPAHRARVETRRDAVPAVSSRQLRSGVRTLALQSLCPLRAFLESRLQATPLETVRAGLSARQRGIVTHSSVQALYRELPSQNDLASWSVSERSQRVDACVRKSLRGLFGPAEYALRAIVDLEAARLRSVLAGLLELELTRDAFQVKAVEIPVEASVGAMRLICRVDRIDELVPDGALAIIDYKTGSPVQPRDWFRERPRNLQLPLYALAVQGNVRGVAVAAIHPRNLGYKGIWAPGGTFPGRSARLPDDRSWSMQLSLWRDQIELLAREYARGDGRLFKTQLKLAKGAYAPLTRVHELVARQRQLS